MHAESNQVREVKYNNFEHPRIANHSGNTAGDIVYDGTPLEQKFETVKY